VARKLILDNIKTQVIMKNDHVRDLRRGDPYPKNDVQLRKLKKRSMACRLDLAYLALTIHYMCKMGVSCRNRNRRFQARARSSGMMAEPRSARFNMSAKLEAARSEAQDRRRRSIWQCTQ